MHTKIGGEAAHEDTSEPAIPQIAGEARGCVAVVLVESRVGVDSAAETLADDQFRSTQVEIPMEGSSLGSLHAMVGPRNLFPVVQGHRAERLLARVRRRKGQMSRGMPVLSCGHVVEIRRQAIDHLHDRVAVRYFECASGTEIVLHVDDEQYVRRARSGFERHRHLVSTARRGRIALIARDPYPRARPRPDKPNSPRTGPADPCLHRLIPRNGPPAGARAAVGTRDG